VKAAAVLLPVCSDVGIGIVGSSRASPEAVAKFLRIMTNRFLDSGVLSHFPAAHFRFAATLVSAIVAHYLKHLSLLPGNSSPVQRYTIDWNTASALLHQRGTYAQSWSLELNQMTKVYVKFPNSVQNLETRETE